MNIYIVMGVILSGWAMLSVLGAERQRELVRVRRWIKAHPPIEEEEVAPVTPPPPAGRSPVKPVTLKAPTATLATAKPPLGAPAPAKTPAKAQASAPPKVPAQGATPPSSPPSKK